MLGDCYRFANLGPFRPTGRSMLRPYRARGYTSIPKPCFSRFALFSSVISRSFMAQDSASPFVETVRNTFTNPKPRRGTTLPSVGMSTRLMATFPWPSGLTIRLLLSRIRKRQPKEARSLRFSNPEGQLSIRTYAGSKPRPLASTSISRKCSFLVFPEVGLS